MDPYPDSQSLELAPIMQAVFADIQARQVKMGTFQPSMTPYPPPDTDPGLAYHLSVYDRNAHMTLHRYSPNAEIEVYFGTGGYQFGPKRIEGTMVFQSQWIDLLSLFTVVWITFKLNQMCLLPWSMKAIVGYYPDTVANPLYANVLRTFCQNVLGVAQDSFTSNINVVGHLTDYDDV